MSFVRRSLPAIATAFALFLTACTTPPQRPAPVVPAVPAPSAAATLELTTYAALPGWGADDQREAWPAFLTSCSVLIKRPQWSGVCAAAREVNPADGAAIRSFFESSLNPYRVVNADGTDTGLVTGYYEPLLRGSRKRGGNYKTPLYRAPEDLLTIDLSSVYPELKNLRLRGRVVGNKVVPYASRGELTQSAAMKGKELVWVDDPVEAFFLQVQGSGRVELDGGKETIRLAYADQNGLPYKSIGRYLVDKGEMKMEQASAQNIKAWVASHPARQQEVLNANPSYVFFREEPLVDAAVGPKGAQGVPLTPGRSIAVDPQHIALGAPVFLSTTQPNSDQSLQRLVMAQDTGGAIRGAVRADYFWGFGREAGERAGAMKQRGMLWVLLPK
ncbi:murein transglycosylase A [Herbaspirillum sp. RTI4]|uniref:murein transglycosylase A n=1 Tax=Herbaspirillum sp. RTI4 TaxID=3048640 RepID=UPI002AB3FAA9|nr:murein transglycosylase A [Herbaspirillum sp. RTI4]MDY7577874.1 murein transglycosylase A [Herbaspirillum sp. RTI4]MEA9983507.1 murein transglycosylase A [Herbaspirillum sp. RTI4]